MLSEDFPAGNAVPAGGSADEAPESPAPNGVAILVCSSCRGPDGSDSRPRPGERLAEATRRLAGEAFPVRVVECLGNCKRRLSAALVSADAWTYVFGDLAETNAPDLLDGAKLLRNAPDGLLPWRGRPDSLKRGLVARIPPASRLKDIS